MAWRALSPKASLIVTERAGNWAGTTPPDCARTKETDPAIAIIALLPVAKTWRLDIFMNFPPEFDALL
jgi:hypothetical protein